MSPNFPNLLSPAFLTFSTCPLNPTANPSTASTHEASPGIPRKSHLLATISQNMTLSTTPTFICIDSSGASFALTIILEAPLTPVQLEGSAGGDDKASGTTFDIRQLKKGHTVVIPDPMKHGVKEGKQGYVKCRWGDLAIIPASLEKLLGMSERLVRAREDVRQESQEDEVRCQSCDRKASEEELSKCKGCSEVWYCDKECQTVGWNEKGHKGECKVLKVVSSMDLEG